MYPPHLDFIGDMEGGLFMLELLEVFRRWVWVFFRVEKEMLSSGGGYMGVLETAEEGLEMDATFKD